MYRGLSLLASLSPGLWSLIALVLGCAGSPHAPESAVPAADRDGPALWMQVAGDGEPTVVFVGTEPSFGGADARAPTVEAAGGDDSPAWAAIEPAVRLRSGVKTVVYDRAGLGKSAATPGPYHIDHEVAALEHGLARFGVKGPIVLVAHAYGGFIAELMAATDRRVAGVVLVDANLPAFFDDAALAHLQGKYLPQLPALERARPGVAQVMGPILRGYPETVARVKAAAYPAALPTIDIVAEHSWGDTDEENAAMRQVHATFVAGSPAREAVLAVGSSHDVMHDDPEVVITAISHVLQRLHTGP